MEKDFLRRKANGEKILFSELLENPPSDDVLIDLFSYSRGGKPYISQYELKVLKLRLDGLTAQEVGEILNISSTVVSTRFRNTCEKLTRGFILDYIEIDVPGIRRLCGMPILITSGYSKLSELLRDMPSDQELLKLSIERGHIVGLSGRRALRNEDLSLLKKKMDGQTNAAIAKEYCVSPNYIRQRLVWIHKTIIHDLGIQIDLEKL